MKDLIEWVRATIEGDRFEADWLAKTRSGIGSGGRWTQLGSVVDTGSRQIEAEYEFYARHFARHDPRDTIARCEAELAILEEHAPAEGWDGNSIHGLICVTCSQGDSDAGLSGDPYPCRTVRVVAKAYRHRDPAGYAEVAGDWEP